MKAILTFLITALLQIHKGTFMVKMFGAIKLALPLSVGVWLVELFTKWSISNRDYIAGVLTCIAIDHIIGSIHHAFRICDFTFKKNVVGLIAKLSLCAASVILFEIIHYTVKDAPWIYEYLKITTRLIVLLYPAGSAFMNMSALTNGVFPPIGWIKKIKTFNEDLDLEKFKINNGSDNA